MIQAAIFDVFGTLVDWREGVAKAVQPALQARGLEIDPHLFADRWRAQYAPSMATVRTGQRDYVSLDVLHRENLDVVLSTYGVEAEFSETDRDELNRAWEQLPPWPDVLEGLESFRSVGFLAPCSNASVALSIRLARFAKFHWDTILGAEIARNYKPSNEVYVAAARSLGLPASKVVMVAAHNSDLAAAASAGLQTAFIPRRTEHGRTQSTDLNAQGNWNFQAETLPDLATIIRNSRQT